MTISRSDIVWQPLDSWPAGELRHPYDRQRSRFDAGFGQTLTLLFRELGHLNAVDIVIEADLTRAQIRVSDGWPKAASKVPPPVKLSFSSKHGPLVYATDLFTSWTDNLRAIALGLEALRKVDRYGITDHGQQYAGWAALPAGTAMGSTREQAINELHRILKRLCIAAGHADTPSRWDVDHNPGGWLKDARRLAHPDAATGDHETFLRVQALAGVLS